MAIEKIIQEYLSYSPEAGTFTWVKRRRGVKLGSIAGCMALHGYVHIGFSGKTYLAHRLAWLFHTGNWPNFDIDHIDGNRSNNRISNLREATRAENHQNKGKSELICGREPTSKYVGVSYDLSRKKWKAEITKGRIAKFLGRYDSQEEAHDAYRQAKNRMHEFQPVPRENIKKMTPRSCLMSSLALCKSRAFS